MTLNQLITASGGLLTTSNVLTTPLYAAQWQSIWNAAVANQVAQLNCSSTPTPAPCAAASALSGTNALNFGSSAQTQVQLCKLVSVNTTSTNSSTCTGGNLSTPALSANLNALETFTTEAELANGTNALDLGTALGLPGVTDAKVTLDLIQPPQVAYGPVGTTASTAQVSSDLQLNVSGSGLVNIPLSVAEGTASLTTLTCAYNAMSATDIQPITNAVTGTASVAGNGVGTLSVAALTTLNTSPLPFATGVVPPTATTVTNGTNPQSAGSTMPNPTWSGLTVTNPSALYTLLTSNLQGVLGPILQVSGVSVGGAQVTDLSSNCGSVALVQ